MDIEVLRSSQLLRVIRQRVLVLRHTDREAAESHGLDLADLSLSCRFVYNSARAVDLAGNLLDLLLDREFILVERMEL